MLKASGPDGIVCANDRTAARLMHTLLELGHDVPGAVRLVGIDDLGYAELLPVPLTTYRQPTTGIGAQALAVMLERVERPDLPIRDILLHGELVVRGSCGASGGPVAPGQPRNTPMATGRGGAAASSISSRSRRTDEGSNRSSFR
jgi:DNA-binding LacI/PurR family transcriptional regulator